MNKKATIGEKPRLSNLLKNWIHQSLFYMDATERMLRIILELLEIFVITILLSRLYGHEVIKFWILIASFLVVHTINWVLNGNWWACILFAFPNLRNPGEAKTCRYLNAMGTRLKKSTSISGILIFGSLSRGMWHERSDIDLRILRKLGLWNAIASFLVITRERMFAFLKHQPLDMYLADDIDFLLNMRKDEPPIFLMKRDARLEEAYPFGKVSILKQLRSVSL